MNRQGDTGAPLVSNNTLIGLTILSYKTCDNREYPALFTRVSEYADFIDSVIHNNVTGMRIKSYPLYI